MANWYTEQQIVKNYVSLIQEYDHKEGGTSQGQNDGATELTPQRSGSGFFIGGGYFCTAAHVVHGASGLRIRHNDRIVPAQVVMEDNANDVAILKAEGAFPPLPVKPSREVKIGASVFTLGYPNIELQGFSPKLTSGTVSSLASIAEDPRHFQVSVPLQPGNSGGPLIDMEGNVIGMLVMKLDELATAKITGSLPQNVNCALKSSYLLPVMDSIPGLAEMMSAKSQNKQPFEKAAELAQKSIGLVLVY